MPAENAAIAEGGHPHDITERNMASITEQIKRMGFSTIGVVPSKVRPPLLQGTAVFQEITENGLAIASMFRNWALHHRTCERTGQGGALFMCNGPVMQKEMSQWFLNLPVYGQELQDGLESINFLENVKSFSKTGLVVLKEPTFCLVLLTWMKTSRCLPPPIHSLDPFVTLAPEHLLAASLVEGTERPAWRELHDEVSASSEFDRINNGGMLAAVSSADMPFIP